jgi:methionine-rich copper-binding protein CopC
MVGRLAAVFTVVLLGSAWPAPASAHTELVSSSPADGARVKRLPATIELTFSEALATPAFVTVTDPSGSAVGTGKPTVENELVRQQTNGGVATGEYTVEYRVVAGDGHPVTGSLRFTVTSGSQGSTSENKTAPAERANSVPAETTTDGFWEEHWQAVAFGGGGLLAGIAVLGAGMRARH